MRLDMDFKLNNKQKEIRILFSGPEKNQLIYGGSRSSKTFFICYCIATRSIRAPGSRHVIFRKHGVAVKHAVGMDTWPKMMALAYPDIKFRWKDRDGYFLFENKSEVWLAGLDDKERVEKVLGKEYVSLYFNEASEIPLSSYIVAQTRLSQQIHDVEGNVLSLRNYVDLNPTTNQHWTYRLWVDGINPDGEMPVNMGNYVYAIANPQDNIDNLSQDYIDTLMELPERQRRRFFEGLYSADDDNALWRRNFIKRTQDVPDLTRVVVSIDPAVTNIVGSNETGIIVAGSGSNGCGYILADGSGKYRPEEWAARAISLYDEWGADRIVAERNNGGDMVEATIRALRPDVSYKSVWSSRGKVVRAEPTAALYERGKIFHVGMFEDLETQMCTFTIDMNRTGSGYSPDRVDALIFALTDLFPSMTRRNTTPILVVDNPIKFVMASGG